MGGPAGVSDAEGASDGVVGDDRLKIAQLAGGAAELEAGGIAGDSNACGVIAAVFEATQAFDDDRNDRFRTNVSNDSAHKRSVDGEDGFVGGEKVDFCGMGKEREEMV